MNTSNAGTYKKILLCMFFTVIALILILPFALKKYLATPHAASQLSRILSDTLGQAVVIMRADISNGALQLKGLSLANPDGFPESNLLKIDSITIIFEWYKLLSDKRTFENITLEGITVDLRRNKAGIWNFNSLQNRFSSSKPSPAEVFIRQFKITKGTLQINDQRLAGLALNISNLATKGSEKSGFNLEFDDPGHNHYALSGRARLSKELELDMSLSSSSISLKSLSGVLRSKSDYLPEQGNANLQLSAELRKGIIRGSGEINFNAAVMPAVRRGDSFSGNLSLSAGYDLQKDRLTVENLVLHLNKLLAVRASGSVRELRQAKHFVIDVGTDEIDIGTIAPLIPELGRNKITIGGKLARSSLHLSGSAVDGINTASGKLGFTHGLLQQNKRLFFNDLNGTAALSGTGDHLTIAGKVTQTHPKGEPILETLDAPYKVTLNRHLKSGKAQFPGLSARAQGISFTGNVSYAEGTGRIENAAVKAKDISVGLDRLSARIPLKQVSSETTRYPLSVDFSGCDVRHGDALLKKLSGSIRGAYASAANEKWLEGTAGINAGRVSWQGKEADAPMVHAEFSKSGAKADFKASVLGGLLQGDAVFNPFAMQEKVAFRTNAKGIQLAGIKKYAGLRGETSLSSGSLDAGCNGYYSKSGGLFCHLDAQGKNIAITGKGSKTVLSDGGMSINSDLSGKKLVINGALLTVGKDVAVRASGTLENAFVPERQGRITVTVPSTPVSAVMDSFLNVLPRSIQEATAEGSLAAEGAVDLRDGTMLVDGAVTLANISIDAPTEKIKVSKINGVFPFSLDLAGKAAAKLPPSSSFNRQNYDTLLKQLRQTPGKGDTITIGSSSFGGLGVESAKLTIRAARGVTEILSLDSSLYDGNLYGKGFVTAQKGILYRGDILFNGLSLVQLCKAFPAITGYISGKIDGIVSLQGNGKQLSDISGFTELWARESGGEKMLVSKEFLQRLSGKKLSGFFFSSDRAYDHAGITAALEKGFLTFDSLDISHTNFVGVRDLSVTIAPSQNRIAIEHLLNSIKEATVRGKSAVGPTGKDGPAAAPLETEFKWVE